MSAEVSVIIRVKNGVSMLGRAIASARDSAPGVEVVVVDNMSTDGTHALAERIADVVVRCSGALGGMRRPGVEASSRPISFFMDVDHVLIENTVAAAVTAIRSADAVVVPERPLHRSGALNRLIATERAWAELSGMGIPRVFWREPYLQYVPPDGVLFGEDRLIGRQVQRVAMSAVEMLHDEPVRAGILLKKYFAYGRTHSGAVGSVVSPWRAALRYVGALARLPLSDVVMTPPVAALKLAKAAAFYAGVAQRSVHSS